MKNIIILLFVQLASYNLYCQNVGINETGATPNNSAGLDVDFTDKGLLFPRLTSAQRDNVNSPAAGLVIYNSDCNELNLYNGTSWVDIMGNTANSCGMIVATGGTITTDGNFKVHVFNSSGTFEIISGTGDVEYLVIAGGGGGGSGNASGGGGGAGGYREDTKTAMGVGSYVVTIGAGGVGGTMTTAASNGSNSVFDDIISIGGGAGGDANGPGGMNGKIGGSGGGGGYHIGVGGAGTSLQGNAGGDVTSADSNSGAGGGGGAGAAGGDGQGPGGDQGGDGGAGLSSSITGSAITRAGGGGGGTFANLSGALDGGAGGNGGGGNGGSGGSGGNDLAATPGAPNTGGGGGGAGTDISFNGGNGGSGVVIVRYQFQ